MVESATRTVMKCPGKKTYCIAASFALLLLVIVVLIAVAAKSVPPAEISSHGYRLRRHGRCPVQSPADCAGRRTVLLVSMDGFRHDYLSYGVTPTLNEMKMCGSSTPRVRPSFPSKTFPNHYSIVTGLYPESHGIVGNTIYDPRLPGRKFRLGKPESMLPVWWLGEPVWKTVQNAGMKSAVFFWPGSEVAGHQPDYFKRYDEDVPFSERVSQVIEWLLMPEDQRPSFLAMYFNQPDTAGHKFGPDSHQVKAALAEVDKQLASLLQQLEAHKLLSCVDIIATSDHGMTATQFGHRCNTVVLDDIVPGLSNVSTFVDGPIVRIRPHNESAEFVEQLVDRLDCRHPALRLLRRQELPVRWHFSDSARIEPLIGRVDEGFLMSVAQSDFCRQGSHGYDNDLHSMQNIFIAYGSSFKENYEAAPFENIQVRSLIETILALPHVDTNATRHSLDHLLVNPPVNLTSVGSPPVIGPLISDVITSPCCDQSEHCSCQSVANWRGVAASLSVREDLFPLPVDPEFSSRKSVLHHGPGFVAALDSGRLTYRWMQYSLQRDTRSTLQVPAVSHADEDCHFRPVNSSDSDSCPDHGNNLTSLYHAPGVSSYYQLVSSTQYPMFQEYRLRIQQHMHYRIDEYSAKYRHVSVLTGPIYADYSSHSSGMKGDVASHFFYQLRLCDEDCSPVSIVHKQWILPHKPTFSRCEGGYFFVDFHEVTLKDLERISGLVLFSGLDVSNPHDLYRSHAHFSTQLPDFNPPNSWVIH